MSRALGEYMNLVCRLGALAFYLHQWQHLTSLQLRDKSELEGFNLIHCLVHLSCMAALNMEVRK